MRRVLCFVGFHHWEHHINREKGGPGNGWDLCSHCGREKTSSLIDNPRFIGF